MTDKNLIFLISQPRSGSTLTQEKIGSHKDVYTCSEPWIMLHPLYTMKKERINVEYNKFLIKSMNEIKTSKIYRLAHILTKAFQRVKS